MPVFFFVLLFCKLYILNTKHVELCRNYRVSDICRLRRKERRRQRGNGKKPEEILKRDKEFLGF